VSCSSGSSSSTVQGGSCEGRQRSCRVGRPCCC
jgi:hypothetical protein